MESNTFTYQYSAKQNREVETIRKKYLPQEPDKLEQLKHLDARVRTAGQWQSLTLGIVGALLFGIGLCFGLDVLAGADWLTLLFALLGAAVMLPAYLLYRHIAKKTRDALTPEILRLSEELLTPNSNSHS